MKPYKIVILVFLGLFFNQKVESFEKSLNMPMMQKFTALGYDWVFESSGYSSSNYQIENHDFFYNGAMPYDIIGYTISENEVILDIIQKNGHDFCFGQQKIIKTISLNFQDVMFDGSKYVIAQGETPLEDENPKSPIIQMYNSDGVSREEGFVPGAALFSEIHIENIEGSPCLAVPFTVVTSYRKKLDERKLFISDFSPVFMRKVSLLPLANLKKTSGKKLIK